MTVVQDPTVQRRRLRMELRRARDAAGFKQTDVAKAMEWSPSKIIRIERGDVGVSISDLRALLNYYGVSDESQVDELLDIARSARGVSFYDKFSDLLKPGFATYLAFEGSASLIRQYDPIWIPGLLQTEEYARGLFEGIGTSDQAADRLWELRLHRQEVHERDNPPEMQFVLDEAALRRQVSWVGRENTMLHQLKRIKDRANDPHITIHIMPFSKGAHPGMDGNFIVLEFADPNLEPLVHLEHLDNVTVRDDAELTATYLDKFERIQNKALPVKDSMEFLDALIDEMASAN
jgi:transcriptional regulator with XRE-family HTH domain